MYVRLGGCYSAACEFCDTKFSWGDAPAFRQIGDRDLSIAIAKKFQEVQPKRLTITGGEPLHFIEWFPDIFEWINSLAITNFNYLGIESNGNLLKDTKICMELIKSFNEIIRLYGIVPTLTISPKLDAKTCYESQITQEDVNRMYFEAFKNISDYLSQYHVAFKFIYDYTSDHMDFQHEKLFIDYLIEDLDVERSNIFLMPYTPEDPLGKDKKIWEESKDATARKALEMGVTYSPRIHVDRRLD
jgi:organic radical activating enzyme